MTIHLKIVVLILENSNNLDRGLLDRSDFQERMSVFNSCLTFLAIVEISTYSTFITNSLDIVLFAAITRNSFMDLNFWTLLHLRSRLFFHFSFLSLWLYLGLLND